MLVHVCDALCGAGKTQSCIAMMNANTDKKYIFITPYLDEVQRILDACSSRGFVEPKRQYKTGGSKLLDLHALLREGKNIASTHSLFSYYTDETKELLEKGNYTLVLDEVIDLFHPVGMDCGDIDFLVRNNIAKKQNDQVVWDDEDYRGIVFSDIVNMSNSRNLVDYDGTFYFWSIPIDVFRRFSDCYVLTYMFEYQLLRHYFDVNCIEYELIGTKCVNGIYSFCNISEMDRRHNLKSKIHICKSDKFNEIGDAPFSLSAGWFDKASREDGTPRLIALRNNIYNYFRDGTDNGNKLWTTFNKYRTVLKGKGYASGFVVFNKRASNDYADRHKLVYGLNVYMLPWMKNYLVKIGAKNVNQDMYALSILIQWIFRSAIRKGEEISIYIPSKRMRFLLERWLDNLAQGCDLKELNFNFKKAPHNKQLEIVARGLSMRKK